METKTFKKQIMEKLVLERLLPNCIRTFSGINLNIIDPQEDMIQIEDIAHGLSHVCRYSGQIRTYYSVAQHSVYCSSLVGAQLQLDALMHDATEAYMQDIPSPIKANLPDYKKIENRLMQVIGRKFKVRYPFANKVKWVDRAMLEWEWSCMILSSSWLDYWSPAMAKTKFLETFNALQ